MEKIMTEILFFSVYSLQTPCDSPARCCVDGSARPCRIYLPWRSQRAPAFPLVVPQNGGSAPG